MSPFKKPIYITRPTNPSYVRYVAKSYNLWKSGIFTNFGDVHNQLKSDICQYLNLSDVCLCSSGTMGLMLSLLTINKKGTVITTPFTFPATLNAIVSMGFKVKFCDIEPNYYSLDPEQVEKSISDDVVCIMSVHPYGNPGEFEGIESIGEKYGIPVIFDAAPSFGVTYKGDTILRRGTFSVVSTHATKTFSTCEGGFVISQMSPTLERFSNFGLRKGDGCDEYDSFTGLNGKLSELHALFGLTTLNAFSKNIIKRKSIYDTYRSELENVDGIRFLKIRNGVSYNYNNVVVFIDKDFHKPRGELFNLLKSYNVHARLYYKDYSNELCDVSNTISSQVICLPIYPKLSKKSVKKICKLIREGG